MEKYNTSTNQKIIWNTWHLVAEEKLREQWQKKEQRHR